MEKSSAWYLPAGSDQYIRALSPNDPRPMQIPIDEAKVRRDAAAIEGFKEGLAGALAGDGYRGVARGALTEIADTVDFLSEAPTRAAFITPMLLAKGIKWTTGNDKPEKFVRNVRQKAVDAGAYVPHKATKVMRSVAANKALDPKYLTEDAYNQSVLAGRGGVLFADLAIGNKMKLGRLARSSRLFDGIYKLNNTALAMDAAATLAGGVASTVEDVAAIKKRQAMHDAMVGYFNKLTEAPPGPFIKHVPKIDNNFINELAIMEAAGDPRTSAVVDSLYSDPLGVTTGQPGGHTPLQSAEDQARKEQLDSLGVSRLLDTVAGKNMPVWQAAEAVRYKNSPRAREIRKKVWEIVAQEERARREAEQEAKERSSTTDPTNKVMLAGLAGAAGLTAAHQITKRIPALQKRRILRYLINSIVAGGAGYAGWKLQERFDNR